MKTLLTALTLMIGLSSTAHAITDEELGQKCLPKARQRTTEHLKDMNCELDRDLDKIAVYSIGDGPWWVPSAKTIWYEVEGTCLNNGRKVHFYIAVRHITACY